MAADSSTGRETPSTTMTDKDAERAAIVAKYEWGRRDGAQIDPWEDPEFEVYGITDRYGFLHKEKLPPNHYDAKYLQQQRDRQMKWHKMIQKWPKYAYTEKLRKRVSKGIPNAVRPEAWKRLLDIETYKKQKPGVFQAAWQKARLTSPDIRQIDLDVNRTYRDHIMFRERYGIKQRALFHVLSAYSMYNEAVGYCQGMSGIGALMLMYLDEEDAFWALVELLGNKKYAMHGYFIPGLPRLIRSFDHHTDVRQKFLPKLHKHLLKEEVEPSLYSTKWFLQCFLDRAPFSLTLRLWDMYLLEGEVVINAMSYGTLKFHQSKTCYCLIHAFVKHLACVVEDLLKLRFEDAVHFLQTMASRQYDDDKMVNDVLVPCMVELQRNKLAIQQSPTEEVPPGEPDLSPFIGMVNGTVNINGLSSEEPKPDPETAV
jgi:hypothetical protein